ncbi:MAG: hypothetical protein B6226_04120 [Candidatus Cloacimonetes bacterium 4572_65]|nr:MAG: hypothetical protein B6226_04120 [Candidatus Cloacimonetes bacterium 4572_65]
MKKLFVIFLLAVLSMTLVAQNLQIHYDFGADDEGKAGHREHFTTTFEMFKVDNLGSTFAFIDFDYKDGTERESASASYWEITRMFNCRKISGLKAGIQYNDGLNTFGSFGNVWFAGVEYPINLGFVTLNTSVWLRDAEGQDPNFQATVVWFKPFLDGQIIFNGFLDFWGQDNADFDEDGTDSQFVILTEPQIWWDLPWVDKLSIGGELEISQNFIFGADDDLMLCPTAGVKWDF